MSINRDNTKIIKIPAYVSSVYFLNNDTLIVATDDNALRVFEFKQIFNKDFQWLCMRIISKFKHPLHSQEIDIKEVIGLSQKNKELLDQKEKTFAISPQT